MGRPKGSMNKKKLSEGEALFTPSNLEVPASIDDTKYRWYVFMEDGIMKERYYFRPEDTLKLDIIKKFLTQSDAVEYILKAQPKIIQKGKE